MGRPRTMSLTVGGSVIYYCIERLPEVSRPAHDVLPDLKRCHDLSVGLSWQDPNLLYGSSQGGAAGEGGDVPAGMQADEAPKTGASAPLEMRDDDDLAAAIGCSFLHNRCNARAPLRSARALHAPVTGLPASSEHLQSCNASPLAH